MTLSCTFHFVPSTQQNGKYANNPIKNEYKTRQWKKSQGIIVGEENERNLQCFYFWIPRQFENGLSYLENKELKYYGYKYELDESENLWTTDVAYWKLIKQGDEALWKYLEDYYLEVFEWEK